MRFSAADRSRIAVPFSFAIALASLLFVFTGSCSRPPAEDPAAARAAIEANNQTFMKAFEAGDTNALAALYAEDAKLLPPNGERIVGRAAIEGFWASFLQLPVETLRLETVDLHGRGETVTEEGNYVVAGPNGLTVEAGKYIVVWKRTEAGWIMARDMWSSNAPAMAPALPDTATTARS